jgi:hypothetical protein
MLCVIVPKNPGPGTRDVWERAEDCRFGADKWVVTRKWSSHERGLESDTCGSCFPSAEGDVVVAYGASCSISGTAGDRGEPFCGSTGEGASAVVETD